MLRRWKIVTHEWAAQKWRWSQTEFRTGSVQQTMLSSRSNPLPTIHPTHDVASRPHPKVNTPKFPDKKKSSNSPYTLGILYPRLKTPTGTILTHSLGTTQLMIVPKHLLALGWMCVDGQAYQHPEFFSLSLMWNKNLIVQGFPSLPSIGLRELRASNNKNHRTIYDCPSALPNSLSFMIMTCYSRIQIRS